VLRPYSGKGFARKPAVVARTAKTLEAATLGRRRSPDWAGHSSLSACDQIVTSPLPGRVRGDCEPSSPRSPRRTPRPRTTRTPGIGGGLRRTLRTGGSRHITPTRLHRRPGRVLLEAFDDRDVRGAATFAHGLQAVTAAGALQRVQHGGEELCA